jgi:PAS domain-containing protein
MPPGDIYARVFENAPTLLLLERATGRILAVNAAFLRMARGAAATKS